MPALPANAHKNRRIALIRRLVAGQTLPDAAVDMGITEADAKAALKVPAVKALVAGHVIQEALSLMQKADGMTPQEVSAKARVLKLLLDASASYGDDVEPETDPTQFGAEFIPPAPAQEELLTDSNRKAADDG